MLFDSHTHLERATYQDTLPEVLERARAANVSAMITIGAGKTFEYSEFAVALAETEPDVWATVGVHPHYAEAYDVTDMGRFAELAAHPRVVALGEMGLDFHYDFAPKQRQVELFEAQIRLAKQLDLPIVIHSRSAERECLALLDRVGIPPKRGVFHCYTGDLETARAVAERGFYLSAPGIITFKNATDVQEVFAQVPDHLLLIETDAPFLAPHPFRGKRNEPALIVHTAAKLAELRGESLESIAATTHRNACRMYGIDAAH